MAQLSDKEIDDAVALRQADFNGVQKLYSLSAEELTAVIESRRQVSANPVEKFQSIVNRMEKAIREMKEKEREK